MKNQTKIILTDAMSLKEVSPGIHNATIRYERIVGPEAIKNYILDRKDQIVSQLKRKGYSYGLKQITGCDFPVVNQSNDAMVDVPYGGVVINVGTSNPTKFDLNDEESWSKGVFDLELRILTISE